VFDIGGPELIVIAIVILIFAGPKHLPEMMRKLGRITAELRNASRELRAQLENETADLETPAEIGRQIRRELTEELDKPYSDLLEANKAIRQSAVELTGQLSSDLDTEEKSPPKSTTGSGDPQ
jgi:sec-independent protein translocase protein TatB